MNIKSISSHLLFTSSPSIRSTNQPISSVSHVLPFESSFPLWGQSVIFCILLILNLVPKFSCSNKLASFRSENESASRCLYQAYFKSKVLDCVHLDSPRQIKEVNCFTNQIFTFIRNKSRFILA